MGGRESESSMFSLRLCVQLGQRFMQPRVEDSSFVQTKSMLQTLGLEKYEKNFKKGLLTDATLPLLNDR